MNIECISLGIAVSVVPGETLGGVELFNCMAYIPSSELSVARLSSKGVIPVYTPISNVNITFDTSSTITDVTKLLKFTNLISIQLYPYSFQNCFAFLCLLTRLTFYIYRLFGFLLL